MHAQVKVLSEAQRSLVENLQGPADLPVKERRMFYRALERKMEEPETSPALVAKFKAAAGNHAKKPLGC